MSTRFTLAGVAALVGDPSRAAMLLALMDGRALPAGELARAANVSPAAASLHLAKLVEGGLLAVRPEGRHRYYRLARREVAELIEALGTIDVTKKVTSRLSPEQISLRLARTCYDHLAGAHAVALVELFLREDVLRVRDERSFDLGPHASRFFRSELQIEVEALSVSRRPVARACLDWTERRDHLAGALGAAVLEQLENKKWIARRRGSRAVRITTRGAEAFARLGVRVTT